MASVQRRPHGKWRARYRDAGGREHAKHFDRKIDGQKWLQRNVLADGSELDRRNIRPEATFYEQARSARPPRDDHEERRCALYRHYDAAGRLLYVGITTDLHARTKAHASASQWSMFAATATAEWFATVSEARRAELSAIRSESPIFNVLAADSAAAERATRYVEQSRETTSCTQ